MPLPLPCVRSICLAALDAVKPGEVPGKFEPPNPGKAHPMYSRLQNMILLRGSATTQSNLLHLLCHIGNQAHFCLIFDQNDHNGKAPSPVLPGRCRPFRQTWGRSAVNLRIYRDSTRSERPAAIAAALSISASRSQTISPCHSITGHPSRRAPRMRNRSRISATLRTPRL